MNGRSAEEEHRMILQEQLLSQADGSKKTLKELLTSVPEVGDDADFERAFGQPRKVDL